MDYIVCFDIGGTFIKIGLLNDQGEMVFKDKMQTPKCNIQLLLSDLLVEKIKSFQKDYSIIGIGISSCGLIDHDLGEVLFSNNLPGYSGMKMTEILFNKVGIPVSIENDVKSACLGELWRGAIQGKQNVVFLTLGTGIGSAMIIDGKLLNGSVHLAGELGHTVIVKDGRPCGCGRKGCYEQYASTSAFVKDFTLEMMKQGEVVKDYSGEEILKLVKENDPIASKVYKEFIHYISIGLGNVTHLLNPEAIIIGGGIAEQEQFIQDVDNEIKKELMPIYNQGNIVFPSVLGNDAGLYGACYIALKKLNHL